MPLSAGAGRALLRQALGDPGADFRAGQWEAVSALTNDRRKLLVVQRTGWGKSAVYFISTRAFRDEGKGPTLIISPLLALMRNQIEAAERLGLRAATINSSNREEWERVARKVIGGETDALLVSPERLSNDQFVAEVLEPVSGSIGLLVIDEAHCISDWGHDFRPDYRRIVNIIKGLPPNMPVLATTATANDRVVGDIQEQISDITIQRGPLMRDSLRLQAMKMPDPAERLAWLAQRLPELPGSGIVYTSTVRDAEKVARWLSVKGMDAAAYHGSVEAEGFEDSNTYRQALEARLGRNELKAIVATSALGMGYDKPDLGFVIHYQAPGSVVSYYQQVGRAGRAINEAVGILMAGGEDPDIQEFFRRTAFPDEAHVRQILDALDASDGLTERELEKTINLRLKKIQHVLKLLRMESPAPVLKDGSRWYRTAASFRMDRERIDHLTRQREEEWQAVLEYVDTADCRMQYLARALDDHATPPCGRCDNCVGKPMVTRDVSHQLLVDAKRFLAHSEFELKLNRQTAKDGFPSYGFGYNLPAAEQAAVGGVLARWGEAGWGRCVMDDKHAGYFRDQLVAAAAEMILDRWCPEPAPLWLTCIPSLNHPNLVPRFAERLAEALGLPFHAAVHKVRQNEPQKLQQNRYHRCRNLDGVFQVAGEIPSEPVLLVDDVVDSAWTLTVVAGLLRRAGVSRVFPFALASSRGQD